MFSHLHTHSENTLLNSPITVKSLIDKAIEQGQRAVALTDIGNLFGLLDFFKYAKNKEIIPIIGLETYICNSIKEKERTSHTLVLLSKNEEGLKNLYKISSAGYLEGFYYVPRIDKEILASNKEGLILLSGGIKGHIRNLIKHNKFDDAKEEVKKYKEIFQNDFYIELVKHQNQDDDTNKYLVDLASEFDVKTVATNDIYFLNSQDYKTFEILLDIKNNAVFGAKKNYGYTQEQYFKSSDEIVKNFENHQESIDNIDEIVDKCKDFKLNLPGPKFPVFEIPQDFKNKNEYLKHLSYRGFEERFKDQAPQIYYDRMELEISIIEKMGFSEYFLIVWDFIKYAKDNDIPVGPGRGSGAGSLVTFCLKITDVDPIKYDLLFERFLNPQRVSLPDLDIDICYENRDKVIEYVQTKYGKEKVAQIITFGTLKTKAVIKDVARAFGADKISFEEVNRITKLITKEDKSLRDAIDNNSEFKKIYSNPQNQEIIDIALDLENLKRHASVHAAGVVIAQDNIINFVPLYKDNKKDDKKNMPVTQYVMGDLEDCGLVKMDFLGLKTLTIVKKTVDNICKDFFDKKPLDFDINHLNLEDKNVFKMLSDAKSDMVFQFESDGMKNILGKVKPVRIEELTALNALFRPGPLQFIDVYAKRKNGEEKVDYVDESLEKYLKPILEETYGIIVYQEQVMAILQVLGGFSLGDADLVRRAMSKKKAEVMEEQKELFVKGGLDLGFKKEALERVFEFIIPFASYGFNKSHSLAYSLLAYQTAYLKVHYPLYFFASNLNNEVKNRDTFLEYIQIILSQGIKISKPDINNINENFSVQNDTIHFGFAGIEGIGPAIIEEIKKQSKYGKYTSFQNFISRVNTRTVNKKCLESLIKSGVFDSIEKNRRNLIGENNERLEDLIKKGKYNYEENKRNQGSLFEEELERNLFNYDELADYNLNEKIKFESEILGISYLSNDILQTLNKYKKFSNTQMLNLQKDKIYSVVGFVQSTRSFINRKTNCINYFIIFNNGINLIDLFYEEKYEEGKICIFDETKMIFVKFKKQEKFNKIFEVKNIEELNLQKHFEFKINLYANNLKSPEESDGFFEKIRNLIDNFENTNNENLYFFSISYRINNVNKSVLTNSKISDSLAKEIEKLDFINNIEKIER